MKLNLFTLMKGMAMGMAEVVPGVSGGTIAFITGIYEKLLETIQSFNLPLLRKMSRGNFTELDKSLDLGFVLSLLVGMGLGIATGVFVISYLLATYPPVIWSFFFGLILASVLFVLKQFPFFEFKSLLGVFLGTVLALWIVMSVPAGGSSHPFYIIGSGAIAISALMLPGISGSFILILLGMYEFIIPEVKSVLTLQDLSSFKVVFLFVLGCLMGLFAFARWVSFCFKHYRSVTMSLMCGFMLGSVYKIWPWKNRIEDLEFPSMVKEINVMPHAFEGEPHFFLSIGMGILGFGFIFLVETISSRLGWVKKQ
jgi:putative membrane protein